MSVPKSINKVVCDTLYGSALEASMPKEGNQGAVAQRVGLNEQIPIVVIEAGKEDFRHVDRKKSGYRYDQPKHRPYMRALKGRFEVAVLGFRHSQASRCQIIVSVAGCRNTIRSPDGKPMPRSSCGEALRRAGGSL